MWVGVGVSLYQKYTSASPISEKRTDRGVKTRRRQGHERGHSSAGMRIYRQTRALPFPRHDRPLVGPKTVRPMIGGTASETGEASGRADRPRSAADMGLGRAADRGSGFASRSDGVPDLMPRPIR